MKKIAVSNLGLLDTPTGGHRFWVATRKAKLLEWRLGWKDLSSQQSCFGMLQVPTRSEKPTRTSTPKVGCLSWRCFFSSFQTNQKTSQNWRGAGRANLFRLFFSLGAKQQSWPFPPGTSTELSAEPWRNEGQSHRSQHPWAPNAPLRRSWKVPGGVQVYRVNTCLPVRKNVPS